MTDVDLVVNTYERTYRSVLAVGFFDRIVTQNDRDFARRQVIVNNVLEPEDARRRAEALIDRGELDEVVFVSDHLEKALAVTGVTRRDLGRLPHYSDWALVAVAIPGSPWILHWDAEVELVAPGNWIDPALSLVESDRRILAANPSWEAEDSDREFIQRRGPFGLGYGFSDQLFLARRAELRAPIYHHRCRASARYPLAHVALTFEARIDAYMRTARRLRATATHCVYRHPPRRHEGADPCGVRERLRRWRNRRTLRSLKRSHSTDPGRRLYWR